MLNETVIELRGIKREYRMDSRESDKAVIVRALRGIDFSAKEGEFVSVMGPSGSGKSTLMNILGCLDKPSAGTYTLDGTETSKSDSDTFAYIRNRKIGFVFQSFNLLARTTALENVELPLFYRRKLKNEKRQSTQDRKERAIEALKEVGLEERMDHYPSQLSGGQQQRVAIARAMVNDPAFILADEPTGNLDPEMSYDIFSLFRQIAESGTAVLVATHDFLIVNQIPSRILQIKDGKLLE